MNIEVFFFYYPNKADEFFYFWSTAPFPLLVLRHVYIFAFFSFAGPFGCHALNYLQALVRKEQVSYVDCCWTSLRLASSTCLNPTGLHLLDYPATGCKFLRWRVGNRAWAPSGSGGQSPGQWAAGFRCLSFLWLCQEETPNFLLSNHLDIEVVEGCTLCLLCTSLMQ